jgi:hypothetical protein
LDVVQESWFHRKSKFYLMLQISFFDEQAHSDGQLRDSGMAKLQEKSDSGTAHDKLHDCGRFGCGCRRWRGRRIGCGNVPDVGPGGGDGSTGIGRGEGWGVGWELVDERDGPPPHGPRAVAHIPTMGPAATSLPRYRQRATTWTSPRDLSSASLLASGR